MLKVYTDLAQTYPLTPLIQQLWILGEFEVKRIPEPAGTVTDVVSLTYISITTAQDWALGWMDCGRLQGTPSGLTDILPNRCT